MKKVTILSTILSLILATPTKAEITQKYDQFKGVTNVSLTPNNSWDGVRPTLYINTQLKGQGTENRSVYNFSVILRSNKTQTCVSGVTGVIADGERVKTMEEISRQAWATPKMKIVQYTKNGTFGRQPQYLALSERYYPAEFDKIANAQSVKYQLCGKDEWVYELSAQERAELKQYAQIVIPQPTQESKNRMDEIDELHDKWRKEREERDQQPTPTRLW